MNEYMLAPIILITVFTLLGTTFFLIGYIRSRNAKFYSRTTGIIIQKETQVSFHLPNLVRNDDGQTKGILSEHQPTVTYEVEGKQHIYTSAMSQQPGFKIGTKVNVLYDPYQPEKALIDTFIQRGSIFTLLGSIFLGIAIIIFAISFYMFNG